MFKPHPFDFVALLFALACIAGITLFSYGNGNGEYRVHIRSHNKHWYYPLDAEETLSVPGPIGETTVVLNGGTVRITASPCRDKICITMGPISKPGAWIACMPNRVFVRITGEPEEGTDAGTF